MTRAGGLRHDSDAGPRGPATRKLTDTDRSVAAALRLSGLPACATARLLSNQLEIQAEILNHRRYTVTVAAVITERYCMTHSDTGHRNLTVKS